MKAFIDDHRSSYGVEPICKVLPIASSTYYVHVARQRDPAKESKRTQRDTVLCQHIKRVWEDNFNVYGARKVWRQLQREAVTVARWRVRTTFSDSSTACPSDHVNRNFYADHPNTLWVADFTYVSTWQGFVYVAFIIDVFARRIVGWKVSASAKADFVLDALEQAVYERQPARHSRLIHHSDRGKQYVSICYTGRLMEAGIEPSVGSMGDSYDNALAETINGLYKTEVIYRKGPWRNLQAVELATLKWVDWFNHRRLLSSIGHVPPAELEAAYYQQFNESAMSV